MTFLYTAIKVAIANTDHHKQQTFPAKTNRTAVISDATFDINSYFLLVSCIFSLIMYSNTVLTLLQRF